MLTLEVMLMLVMEVMDMEEKRWLIWNGHDAEGTLHHLGQLLSGTLDSFIFLLSDKNLCPGVSVELTEYCIR